MYIEKNLFNNILNMFIDVKGKSISNLNAGKDMCIICNRLEIAMPLDINDPKLKVYYTLTWEQRKKLCEWFKVPKFLDGYASNIRWCFDMNKFKLHDLESHNCHMLMERLPPMAIKEWHPKFVWSATVEINLSFQ